MDGRLLIHVFMDERKKHKSAATVGCFLVPTFMDGRNSQRFGRHQAPMELQ